MALGNASDNEVADTQVEIIQPDYVADVSSSTANSGGARINQQRLQPAAVTPAAVATTAPGTLNVVGTGLVKLASSGVLGGQLAELLIAHPLGYTPIPWGFLTDVTEETYTAFPDIFMQPTAGFANVIGQFYQITATRTDVLIDYIADSFAEHYVRFYLIQPVANVPVIASIPRSQLF